MLNNIQIDNFLKIKIGLGLAGLLFVVFVNFGQVREIFEFRSQKSHIEQEIMEAQAWQEITAKLRQQNNLVTERLNKLYLEIPEKEVLSSIVSFIQASAKESKVEILAILPGNIEVRNNAQEIAFEMTVEGLYSAIGRFLFRLENSQYVLRVNHFDLSAEGMVSRNLSCTIEMVVFQMNTSRNNQKNVDS